jgi:hypothetical protein
MRQGQKSYSGNLTVTAAICSSNGEVALSPCSQQAGRYAPFYYHTNVFGTGPPVDYCNRGSSHNLKSTGDPPMVQVLNRH